MRLQMIEEREPRFEASFVDATAKAGFVERLDTVSADHARGG